MFDRVLRQIQDKIRQYQYVVTLHADEEMTDDGLVVYDLEEIILKGEILERQKDKNTSEWKYRIRGTTLEGEMAEVVAKLGVAGRVVIITVYLC